LVKAISEPARMRALRYGNIWFGGGILLMLIVLYSTVTPGGLMPSFLDLMPSFLSDKALHLLAFMVLMVWFCGVFRLRLSPLVALTLLAFGIGIELIQSLLPYRSAEVADAMFDFGGILLGWALAAAGLGGWAAMIEAWFLEKDPKPS
jgi:glycopeptide antibiotics resistance protein